MWNDKLAETSGPVFDIQLVSPSSPQAQVKCWGTARPPSKAPSSPGQCIP